MAILSFSAAIRTLSVAVLTSVLWAATGSHGPHASQGPKSPPVTWELLSGNAGSPMAVDLGLTYSYPEPPNNPGDDGRRLLDGDLPADDWNNVVGFSGGDKSVEFQWPEAQKLGRVRLRMASPKRSREVDVFGRLDSSQAWQPLGKILPEQQEQGNGWYDLTLDHLTQVRQVRLDLRMNDGGLYLHEVQLWGIPGYAYTGAVLPKEQGSSLVLAEDQMPRATIVLARNASDKARGAAFLLQNTLYKMTGAGLPIVTDDQNPRGALLLVGPSSLTAGTPVRQGGYPVQEQSIAWRDGQNILLAGNDAGAFDGTRRAVYLFLESLGCGWFGPARSWKILPKVDAPVVDALHLKLTPAFPSRAIQWPWARTDFDPTAWGLGGAGVFHAHNFGGIVPKDEKTFREHPDWFAMVNGKRQMSQFSFTSPEVVDRAAAFAHQFFHEHPDFTTFSLSPDDAGGFDESPEALAIDGTPGGRLLALANAVERKVRQTDPGKEVVFYAYWFTKAAPTRVEADPGVDVMIINDTCQAHSFDDASCPTKEPWLNNFAAWKRTGAKLSVYEWYVPAVTEPRWQSIPFIRGDAALNDLRFYRSQGVAWMNYESVNGERADNYPLRWPLYFAVARGMENPNLSFKQIMDPACEKLFGAAGKSMSAFYCECASALASTSLHTGNWTPPNPRHIYTPEVEAELDRLLAEAAAHAGDPAAASRIAQVQSCWNRAKQSISQFPD